MCDTAVSQDLRIVWAMSQCRTEEKYRNAVMSFFLHLAADLHKQIDSLRVLSDYGFKIGQRVIVLSEIGVSRTTKDKRVFCRGVERQGCIEFREGFVDPTKGTKGIAAGDSYGDKIGDVPESVFFDEGAVRLHGLRRRLRLQAQFCEINGLGGLC